MSRASVQDLQALVKQGAKGLGLDEHSSSIIIANINATTAPLCVGTAFDDDESNTDDFRLIYFIIDVSQSMEDVIRALIDAMNDIVFPGLLGGAASQVGAIRFGGIIFSTDIKPLWPGWRKLDKDFPRLDPAVIVADGSTVLNRACIYGATSLTTQALQVKGETGTYPECVLVAISDGANREAPKDPKEVNAVFSQLDPRLVTTAFLGFETWEQVDFPTIAQGLGFREVQHCKLLPGESKEDMQRRMRHMMGVFSQSLIKRVSTSQVAAPAPAAPGGSTGFWTPGN